MRKEEPKPFWHQKSFEELPKYVKWISSPDIVFKVENYQTLNLVGVPLFYAVGIDKIQVLKYFEPATKQEYLDYVTKKMK